MDAMPVVLDISSDDEPCFEAESFDWLEDFLGVSDEEAGDSDDVVFVSEVKANPRKTPEPVKDLDDDDCVVLDGDPDKSISAGEEPDDGSDEIVVVGQKGQIACRDYPHPRHHCARFPFATTPHEKHCYQCHCYVCDSHAPCLHWGTGLSVLDHCHATDKVLMWKGLRTDFKKEIVSAPALKPTGHSYGIQPPAANHDLLDQNVPVAPNSTLRYQTPASIITLPYCPLSSSIPQNQSSMAPVSCALLPRLNTSCVSSSTVRLRSPFPVHNGQNQVSVGLLPRKGFQSSLIHNQALCSNSRRNPGYVAGCGPRLGPTSVIHKRLRTNGIGRSTLSGAPYRYRSSLCSSIPACANAPYYESTAHPNLVINRVPLQSCMYVPPVIQSTNGHEIYHLKNRVQDVHSRNNGFQSISQHHDGQESSAFQNMNPPGHGGGFQNVNQQEDGGGFQNVNQHRQNVAGFQNANQHDDSDGFSHIIQETNRHPVDMGFLSFTQQGNQHLGVGNVENIIQLDTRYQFLPHDTYQPENLSENISQQRYVTADPNHLVSNQGLQSQSLQTADYSADPIEGVKNTIQSQYPPTEGFQEQEKVGSRNEPLSVLESVPPYSGDEIDLEFEKWLSETHALLMSPERSLPDVGLLTYDISSPGEM